MTKSETLLTLEISRSGNHYKVRAFEKYVGKGCGLGEALAEMVGAMYERQGALSRLEPSDLSEVGLAERRALEAHLGPYGKDDER